jgi:hypothetical protein
MRFFPASVGGGGGLAKYGDGSDGDVEISGSSGIGRDMYYNNLTITATGNLGGPGYKIFVKETLTIALGGVLQGDGAPASGSSGAFEFGPFGTTNINAGAGGNGSVGVGAGSVGGAVPNQFGGDGGAGGDANAQTGGAGAVATEGAADDGWPPRSIINAQVAAALGVSGLETINGGSGGGGGAADNAGASGGGGGGGGGHLTIFCKTLNNEGTIRANGGAGANGGGAVFAGGGGGGGGGYVYLVANEIIAQGTIEADGGNGGLGFGGGNAGTGGSVGNVVILTDAA